MRYTKPIKGLPQPDEIVISSLSEYTALLSAGAYKNCFFRGEPSDYESIVSSALRGFNSISGRVEYPFIKMKDEFKREVFHKLTADERVAFLAFAQHHGLPTNLVDFTRSPLIALFFACQSFVREKGESGNECMGFIYCIENKMPNITDLISRYEDKNLLELLARDKQGVFKEFYLLFYEYKKSFPQEFHRRFELLIDEWNVYCGNDEILPPLSPFGEDSSTAWDFNIADYERLANLEDVDEMDTKVLSYLCLLRRFLRAAIDNTEPVYFLNGIPNFIYDPILPFERGRNQHGLFIYEAYVSYMEKETGLPVLARQRIWPDKVIAVRNKEEILASLDLLGINEKFIYGDYDSIARYIKRHYQG